MLGCQRSAYVAETTSCKPVSVRSVMAVFVILCLCMWVVDAWPVQFKDAERREGESLQ